MISLSNNPQNPGNDVKLDNNDSAFFNEVNNNITLYGQLPYNIPQKLIIDCIKDAAKYFYEWHPAMTKPAYYYVDFNKAFTNTLQTVEPTRSIKQRGIILPLSPKIAVVRKIYESKNSANYQDLIDETFINSGSNRLSSTVGIDKNMFFTEIATRMVEANMIENILGTTIAFKYNHFDNVLYLKTIPSSNSLMIECKAFVHIHNLYRNSYFKRLVVGYAKRQLKRLIGGHTFELPGGVTLNADEICNNLDDIETTENIIKSMSTVGDIIMER